jgi:hypothetical protein
MFLRLALVVILALAVAPGPWPALAEQPLRPAGTLTFKITSVGLGLGASWGRGTLHFRGRNYPIRVEGLDLAKVGVAELEATGRVFNINKPEEIYGTYNQVSAGVAVVGGIQGIALRNSRGVLIDLSATQRGLIANLGIGTLEIKPR